MKYKNDNMKKFFYPRQMIVVGFLLLMFSQTSCQKCIECQAMRNGAIVYSDEWCYSGPNTKEQLRVWEDEFRSTHMGDSVTCRNK